MAGVHNERSAYKVVVIGDMGVGKTCIAIRFVTDEFTTQEPTVGAAYLTQSVLIGRLPVKLQIWDTAGQERFNGIVSLYYRSARAAIIVYDITDRKSFDKAKDWVQKVQEEVHEGIVMTLVGNKADLEELRVIRKEEGQALAESFGIGFLETSAKSGEGVPELFVDTARRLVEDDQRRNVKPKKRGISLTMRGSGAPGEKTGCCLKFS
ncbi:uncharacterized protein LOC129600018 [Paramacrobiotus metropolitanus]|uniref:uncharacterized protein LOC129600018 n=1 Tax=Paramacrobiotus metropolitanus TaxID=2943436 RepID=UPI0024457045|nr:uncharacterized protein LOC129600018 [Paramacrobiotus metropolitanus]